MPLCMQPSLTHCTKKLGLGTEVYLGRRADPQAHAHSTGTCRWTHITHLHTQMCTTYRTYLDTKATLCTDHTPTHAQVASYDTHTPQTNMHRFSCLSCDSQMVGFSQRATI